MKKFSRAAKTAKRPMPSRKRSPVIAGRVSEALYLQIKAAAEANGRSMSEQLAALAELAFKYQQALGEHDQWKADLVAKQKKIDQGNYAVALRRDGWAAINDPRYGGTVYAPPGQFQLPKSGFLSEEEAAAPLQPILTMTPAVEQALGRVIEAAVGRVVEAAVAKALARAKLTIPEEE